MDFKRTLTNVRGVYTYIYIERERERDRDRETERWTGVYLLK
jgi:hypothetical protein